MRGILGATSFRSYGSVASGLLKPAIREAVVLSGALMTSEESYSGGKAELSQLALDQLQNGVYLTESVVRPVLVPLELDSRVFVVADDLEQLRQI